MPRFALLALTSFALLAGTPTIHAQESTAPQDPGILTKLGSILTFYGFLRIDAVYDTDQMNDTQVPSFVRSEDDPSAGSDDFTLYTRLTRLGLAFDGGEVGDGYVLTGKLETDFYGFDSSDSRNDLRIRHAYLQLEKGEFSLLAGQTWDLFSPLYTSVNPDTLNWNAGNTGDRRPQIRVGYTPSIGEETTLGLHGSIAQQGAVSPQEIDGTPDGVLDGEDSGLPQLQGRVSISSPILTERSTELGVWFAWGREETDGAPINGEDEWDATLFGADLVFPITDDLKLRGEVWVAENGNDFRAGIGQGINATTGDEIAAVGYWAELNYAISEKTSVFVGYSVDDPDDDDLPNLGLDLNELIYAGAHYRVWDPVRFGWEWTHWTSEFVGQSDGENDRFRLWIAYYF